MKYVKTLKISTRSIRCHDRDFGCVGECKDTWIPFPENQKLSVTVMFAKAISKQFTFGILQDSVFRPTLWNIVFNGIP